MKYLYLILFSFGFGYSQIGINNPTPNSSAELDIASTSKGILVPRMTRAERLLIAAPSESLLVYQTDAVGLELPGFYYYQSVWKSLSFNNSSWITNGNINTNPLSNYIGTQDLQPLVFKTAAVEQMRILATGKIGIGTSSPLTDIDIRSGTTNTLKIEDGFQAAGNVLSSTSDGTVLWKNPSDLGYVGWNTFGNSGSKPPANSLGTIDAADLSLRTGGVEALVVQGTGGPGNEGNVRINDTTPTLSQLTVKSNAVFPNPVIRGKNLNTTANSINFGVWGETKCIGTGSYAVKGSCFANGVNGGGIGVLGKYTLSGAAVFGRAYYVSTNTLNTLFNYDATNYVDFLPGRDYGVYGLVSYSDVFTNSGVAVYGKNPNLTIGVSYGMYCQGNMAVGGTPTPTNTSGTAAGVAILKAASVPTTKGNQLVYCKESPEMWFEDFGFGQLQNGTAHIALENLFLETVFIDATHKMHVVLQEQAESKGLYFIVDADHKGFTVKEKKGGNSNISFSYSIMAKRRFYQDQRFGVDSFQPFENNLAKTRAPLLLTTDPMVMKAALEKGIAEKEASFKLQNQKKEQINKETSKTSN
jgi:hypothetical protein